MKGSSKSTTLPKEIPYTRYANFIFVYFKTQSKKFKVATNQNVLVGIRVKSRAAKPPNEQGVSPNASSHIYFVYSLHVLNVYLFFFIWDATMLKLES